MKLNQRVPELDDTRVLVIDDEPQIRRIVRNALGAEGASVIEAAGGREGIDLAAAPRDAGTVLRYRTGRSGRPPHRPRSPG